LLEVTFSHSDADNKFEYNNINKQTDVKINFVMRIVFPATISDIFIAKYLLYSGESSPIGTRDSSLKRLPVP
jgi:hypothetical protein